MALVCIGGVSYLYTRLIYSTCFTNEGGNNNNNPIISRQIQITERSPLINRRDSQPSTDDDDDDDNVIEDNRDPWIHQSRQVSTFKTQDNLIIVLLDKFADTLHPKTVRFHPLSEEHVTFSKEEYQRRNPEYINNINNLYQNPVQLCEIYKELKVIKAGMPKLETIYEHPDEETQENSA